MKKLVFFGTFLLTPMLAAAQIRDAKDLGQELIDLINGVAIPLLFALSFLVFIWGVFQYFIAGGSNEEKRQDGQKLILFGIIGFFVMVAVWGFVNILLNTFNLQQTIPRIPTVPGGTR